MLKVIFTNDNGKIEFTEEDLRKLLEETYDEGYAEGKKESNQIVVPPYIYPVEPYYPYPWRYPYYDYITCVDTNTYTYSTTNIEE